MPMPLDLEYSTVLSFVEPLSARLPQISQRLNNSICFMNLVVSYSSVDTIFGRKTPIAQLTTGPTTTHKREKLI
jgi:hypothetical protein